ncbi:hypothetical protein BH11PSE4_BH11PSE4_25210 [soil metagenome]
MAKKAKGKGDKPEQFSIPAELVEHLLLGPADDRRVLQDSPLLGDVWTAFAADPGNTQDVLITPHRTVTAALVASILPGALKRRDSERLKEGYPAPDKGGDEKAKVAYLQGLVAARMTFDQVLRIVVPLTQWWHEPKVQDRIAALAEPDHRERLCRLLRREIRKPGGPAVAPDPENYTSLERYVALAGLIYWVGRLTRPANSARPPRRDNGELSPLPPLPAITVEAAHDLIKPHAAEIIAGMFALYAVIHADPAALTPPGGIDEGFDKAGGGLIFQVSLNRVAVPALDRSVPAVKADAANSLFKVNCKNIVWAVLDSGIDRTHRGFIVRQDTPKGLPPQYVSRVRKTFDFTRIREIVSISAGDITDDDLARIAAAAGIDIAAAREHITTIAADAAQRRPINWEIVEKLIMLKPPDNADVPPAAVNAPSSAAPADDIYTPPFKVEAPPPSNHGTHVAGIIGAQGYDGHAGGMCPDIRFYDFRVLSKTLEDTEFAVIAALQYIRYVNERHSFITIHGANLSLSIPHNVRNFACGRTPVCNECERLVESGVVVVAAAGNRGFQKFQTNDGVFENYAAFSITDPGNGDGVITVGSTHGGWPQTYGVSFFSSRGPTGDGRMKPDLVAPGERVMSTVPGDDWAPESGTSMAAPHVSGAAAMLLARYDELVGQPRRVKRILCESATDLGRERSFQGHGMLDVLRAFQSI